MTIGTWLRRMALAAAVAALAASCTVPATATPPPTVCDGISSEVGGCVGDRHKFTSSSCDDLAREWAGVLDKSVVAILRGPEVVNNEARSSRLRQKLSIVTIDMTTRLRELALQKDCDLPEFIAAAEPMFTSELRAGVGDGLYDGNPSATYEEWLDDVRSVAKMIDAGE